MTVITPEYLREKTTELRNRLINVLEPFSKENADLPAQVIVGAVGELLIQYSVAQSGTHNTLEFLGHLRDAVNSFSESVKAKH